MIDYAEEEDGCFLVMEYIRGSSLEALRQQGKTFSSKELLELALFITDILSYLHTQSPPILYGDLKPANLMRTKTGKLYLVDMGSAIPDWGVPPSRVEGTKGFAAPEQYEGKVLPQSDLYALGKTLQALQTKRLTPGLARFISRCTKPDPSMRYPDARSAQACLQKLQRRQSMKAPLFSAVSGAFALFLGLCFLGRWPFPKPPSPPGRGSAEVGTVLFTPLPSSPTPTPTPTLTPKPTPTPTHTPTPTPTPSPLPTPSPTPTPTPTPSPSPTPTPTPSPTPSPTPTPSPSPSPTPTPKPDFEVLGSLLGEILWEGEVANGETVVLSLEEEDLAATQKRLKKLLKETTNPEEKLRYLTLLASFAELSGDQELAIAYYETSLALDPENLENKANLGLLLLRHGEEEESRLLWEEAKDQVTQGGHIPTREETLWAAAMEDMD